MSTKIRKQIYIEPDQEVLLKRLSRELGKPEAVIIRQAIETQARSVRLYRRDMKAWEAERNFIKELIQAGPVPGGRDWDRESLHER
jgi:predicted DNA-binding protein